MISSSRFSFQLDRCLSCFLDRVEGGGILDPRRLGRRPRTFCHTRLDRVAGAFLELVAHFFRQPARHLIDHRVQNFLGDDTRAAIALDSLMTMARSVFQ